MGNRYDKYGLWKMFLEPRRPFAYLGAVDIANLLRELCVMNEERTHERIWYFRHFVEDCFLSNINDTVSHWWRHLADTWHIFPWTKWTPFHRRYCHEWIVLYSDSNSTDVCSWGFRLTIKSTLSHVRLQAITWTMLTQFTHWRIYASLGEKS